MRGHGINDLVVENGRIGFSGTVRDIARCNIGLRAADRVVWEAARFPAGDWDELFEGVRAIPWEDLLPRDARIDVTARSVKSSLYSVRTIQGMGKKAIVEALRRRYRDRRLPETGVAYRVDVAVRDNVVTVGVDTTGDGLHKRGYRGDGGEAPLRENLAAGLVLLSRWSGRKPLADPFCGSGTIAIEAAMAARNMAPGAGRRFSAEQWGTEWATAFVEERGRARDVIQRSDAVILASDRDEAVLKKAVQNARRAGVHEAIRFGRQDAGDFSPGDDEGVVVCNPPYGERMGDGAALDELYRALGRVRSRLPRWSFFILTAHPFFERFFGAKAAKNRKLFNGNLLCYLYEYPVRPLPKGAGDGR
jgi:putative N6-adenine-specific DNA methylase